MKSALFVVLFGLAVTWFGWSLSFICSQLRLLKITTIPKTYHVLFNTLFGHGAIAFGAGLSILFHFPFKYFLYALAICSIMVSVERCIHAYRRARIIDRSTIKLHAIKIFTFIVILLLTIGSGAVANINSCDDTGRYFLMAQRLWDTGNIVDPFSNWRTTVSGGSLYIQSIGLQLGGLKGPVLLDLVCGLTLILAIGRVMSSKITKNSLVFFAGLIALSSTSFVFQTNSVPRLTPSLLVAGSVIATLKLVKDGNIQMVQVVMITGGLMAGGITRIQTLALGVAALVSILTLAGRSRILMQTAVALIAAASPWLISARRETGTILFPIGWGNADRNYAGLALPSGAQQPLLMRLLQVDGYKYLVILIAISIVWRSTITTKDRQLIALMISLTLAIGSLFVYLARSNSKADIDRYLAPLVIVTILVSLSIYLEGSNLPKHKLLIAGCVALFGCIGLANSQLGPGNLISNSSNKLKAGVGAIRIERNSESSQNMQVRNLAAVVPKGSTILSAVDDVGPALRSGIQVWIAGVVGQVYPRPHKMEWSYGLSPHAEIFEVSLLSSSLRTGTTYPLIRFGDTANSDTIGVRRSGSAIEFVLQHPGEPLVSSPRLSVGVEEEAFLSIHVDRHRGLVRFATDDGFDYTMSPGGGAFHSPSSKTDYRLFRYPEKVQVKRLNRSPHEFFSKLTQDLRSRGIDYVMFQNPHTSVCLYNEDNWKTNATSLTLYQMQSPYFFAWFEYIAYLRSEYITYRLGNFALAKIN